jgi:metal-sulfur cluster biosynthetic enzyme
MTDQNDKGHEEAGKRRIDKEEVLSVLRGINDPEIPVNIVDLGLIYSVTIVDDWVGVKMTLTTPGCGMADSIVSKVREGILNIPGVSDGDVRLVWQPAWNQGLMSPSAKKQLGVT